MTTPHSKPILASLLVVTGLTAPPLQALPQVQVLNGDFEQGNTGFASDYLQSTVNSGAQQHDVTASPQQWNPNLDNCSDHTSGTGLMMAVNGATSPGQRVWEQTVLVVPNTNYVIAYWATSLHSGNPASLRLTVNSLAQGAELTLSTQTCDWVHWSTTWNSGSGASATIVIEDTELASGGNDFALDDIEIVEDGPANYCTPAVPNSSGASATISNSGSLVISENSFTLHADDLPPNQFGYFLNSMGQDLVVMPGGSQGNLCLGGGFTTGRHNRPSELLNSGSTGSFSLALDLTDMPNGAIVLAGETWNFQAWFRDANPTNTSNFTDGLNITFQ